MQAQICQSVESRRWSGATAERWGFVENGRFYPYFLRESAERDAVKSVDDPEGLTVVPAIETWLLDEPEYPRQLGVAIDVDKARKWTGYAIIVFLALVAELAIAGAIRGCHGGHQTPVHVGGVCQSPPDPCQYGAVYSCTDAAGEHVYYCGRPDDTRNKI